MPPPPPQQPPPPPAPAPPTAPFTFPPAYSFPPFFTLQPNLFTRRSQLRQWSRLIQRYCRHHRLFRLSLPAAVETPLFRNERGKRRFRTEAVREVVEWMAGEEGGRRCEWIDRKAGTCWVFWKRPEEWAEVVAGWVEETGKKNTVLTLYELLHGEMSVGQDFHGMDPDLFQRSLTILANKGRAQVFGSEDQLGVKFF